MTAPVPPSDREALAAELWSVIHDVQAETPIYNRDMNADDIAHAVADYLLTRWRLVPVEREVAFQPRPATAGPVMWFPDGSAKPWHEPAEQCQHEGMLSFDSLQLVWVCEGCSQIYQSTTYYPPT